MLDEDVVELVEAGGFGAGVCVLVEEDVEAEVLDEDIVVLIETGVLVVDDCELVKEDVESDVLAAGVETSVLDENTVSGVFCPLRADCTADVC